MSGTRHPPVQHPAPDDWFSGIGEEGESEWVTNEPQIQNEDWSSPAAGDYAQGDEKCHESGGGIEPTSLSSLVASAARVPIAVVRRRRLIALAVVVLVAIAVPFALVVGSGGGGQATQTGSTTSASGQLQSTAPSSGQVPPALTTESAPASQPPTVELPESATLTLGDRGGPVGRLQRALATLGFDPGTPDGNFGRHTQDAVIAFQKDRGLQPDGIVGQNTARALNKALAEGSASG
jgi:putative peptidoglycan binding protein